jgi:hypothetical protein
MKHKTTTDILKVISDRHLLAKFFDKGDWTAWRSFLAALFALKLDGNGLDLIRTCTGRVTAPLTPFNEAWLICGRRAGKSRILALIAVFLAAFKNWQPFLAAGEKGVVAVLACDRRQAQVIFNYIRAFLTETPMLAPLVKSETAESIELTTGISIEVTTADYRRVRGRTIVAALLDEAAFWRSDDGSANPDQAVLDALRPAMATVPGAMLLVASSPYARRGILFDAWKKWHGKDDTPALVWVAPSRTMNPGLPERLIAEALERDPSAARSEYLAEWRDDVAAFIDREIIEAAVDNGTTVRPYLGPNIKYVAFADPSGGSADSFTLAIAHSEGEQAVLDCLFERKPPFNPSEAVGEVAALLKSYELHEVTGDRYAAAWVVEAFAKEGITYRHSERDRSAIYLDCLPLFTSGRASLLDSPKVVSQFASLERRASFGGKERIDHGPNGHDDLCNASAGALVLASKKSRNAPIVAAIGIKGENHWACGSQVTKHGYLI